jgi:phosphate transport system ATP-binding protein
MSSQLHNQSLIQKQALIRQSENENAEALKLEPPESALLRAEVKKLSFSYGSKRVLNQVSMKIHTNKITAMIGPSGCGKTTLLRCFNRMHDLYSQVTYQGEILIYPEAKNILSKEIDPMEVRMRIGMVFQKPNPFPKSIYENVAFGLRVRGIRKKSYLEDRVEQSLQQAGLWTEVKDRLNSSATSLSGGQQQRVCIARALATQPEMLLLDEPTSALRSNLDRKY